MIKYRVPILYEVDALAKQNNVDVYKADETDRGMKDLIIRIKELEHRIDGLEGKNEILTDTARNRGVEVERVKKIAMEMLSFLSGSNKNEISVAKINEWIKALKEK